MHGLARTKGQPAKHRGHQGGALFQRFGHQADLVGPVQANTDSNLTGINLTVAWMMLGVWATLSRRFFWGGLLLGAAASTGFYSLGTFLALFVLALAQPLPTGNQPRWQRWLRPVTIRFRMNRREQLRRWVRDT